MKFSLRIAQVYQLERKQRLNGKYEPFDRLFLDFAPIFQSNYLWYTIFLYFKTGEISSGKGMYSWQSIIRTFGLKFEKIHNIAHPKSTIGVWWLDFRLHEPLDLHIVTFFKPTGYENVNVWNLLGYFSISHRACINGFPIYGGKVESMGMTYMHAQIRPYIIMFKMFQQMWHFCCL